MKKTLTILITAIIMASCSKEKIEQPIKEAVTIYIDQYDTNWKYQYTFVSIHWHDLTIDELSYYRTFKGQELVCAGETKLQRIVVSADTCTHR